MASSADKLANDNPTEEPTGNTSDISDSALTAEPQSQVENSERTSSLNPSNWRRFRRFFIVILIAALCWVGYKSVDLAYRGWGLYQHVIDLQSTVLDVERDAIDMRQLNLSEFTDIEIADLNLSAMNEDMQTIASDVETLDQRMGFFSPFLRRLSWVPRVGPTVSQGPDLLSAGNAGLQLATDAFSLMQPALIDPTDPASIDFKGLLETAADSPEAFDDLALQAEAVAEKFAAVNMASVDPRIGDKLELADPFMPLLASLIRMAPSAQEMLGMTAPRTYLLLVQNNHELRPTGGFLTAVGNIVVDQGEIVELDFSDSYVVSRRDGEHPPAPEPLRRYMGAHMLLIRDANWSPDLPTAAQVIKGLYAADTGQIVDGIITIDLHAAELVVNALAPLKIEGADEPLTGETLLTQILDFWSKPIDTGDTLAEDGLNAWWGQRKDFMPKLADAALAKVQSGEVDYQKLATALLAALNERSIQVWIDDPVITESLAELQWDGALTPPDQGDFVAVVDSNLGFNKADYVIERSLDYRVAWSESSAQPAKATVTIRYEHPLDREDHVCDITPRYGDTYEDSAARCYFNYVRLYVPKGSELLEIEGIEPDSSSERRGEYGLETFAGYFVMKPGGEHEVTFRYTLPPELTEENYELLIRRQSGTNSLPIVGSIAESAFQTTLETGSFVWSPNP